MKAYQLLDPMRASGVFYAECRNLADAITFFTAKMMDEHACAGFKEENQYADPWEYCFILTGSQGNPKKNAHGAVVIFTIHELNNLR